MSYIFISTFIFFQIMILLFKEMSTALFDLVHLKILLNLSFLQHSLLTNFVKSQTITYPSKYLILPGFQDHRNSLDLRLMIELKGAIFPIPLINFDTRILDFKFRMICKVLNTASRQCLIVYL